MFSRAMEADNLDVALDWNVLECKECGCCAYVCPSKRPMVQQAKFAKALFSQRKAREKQRAGR